MVKIGLEMATENDIVLIYREDEPFSFGTVAPKGWTIQQVIDAWEFKCSACGSCPGDLPGASPDGGAWLHVVPEPSSATLMCLGLLGLLSFSRRRS